MFRRSKNTPDRADKMQHSYRIWRVWVWEILALLLTGGLIITIAVILAIYNGKSVNEWTFRMNLNALLALLSTILRAMLVVVVSQIVSQRKWEWYKGADARPLSDLKKFDSGSRGSFGALLLIPTVLRKDFITAIAAAVLIASFLVGPFVQLASRTSDCYFSASDQEVSLPFAHYVPRSGGYTIVGQGGGLGVRVQPDTDTVVAILSSATAPHGIENQISPSCATGNCSFPDGDPDEGATTFSTVGMCSSCINAEFLVTRERDTDFTHDVFSLPYSAFTLAGKGVSLIGPSSNLNWLGESLTPEHSALSRWAYVNATYLAQSKDGQFTAAVCSLYPCLRTYTAVVKRNKLLEKLIRSEIMEVEITNMTIKSSREIRNTAQENTLHNSLYHYTKVKSPCRANGEIYDLSKGTPSDPQGTKLALVDFTRIAASASFEPTYQNITAPEQCIYRHDARFVRAISVNLNDELFNGMPDSTTSGFGNNAGVQTILKIFYNDGHGVTFSNVSDWFDSFADAMTNRFRFQYGSSNFSEAGEYLAPGIIQGEAWRTLTCFSTHTGWLALPICLAIVTTILSIWTIASNWRHRHLRPVWKDNILPLIFYGHKIKSQESETLLDQRTQDTSSDDRDEPSEEDASSDDRINTPEEEIRLLEASEMEAMGRDRLVTFEWPDAKDSDSMKVSKADLESGRQRNQTD